MCWLQGNKEVEFEASFNAWMSRIPTDSNIADDPSRGDCESLMSMGVSRTEVNFDLVWNDVQEFQVDGGPTTSIEVPHVVKN